MSSRAHGQTGRESVELLRSTELFDEFLADLARLAAWSVDHDLSCGLTVVQDGRLSCPASSDERAERLDRLQHERQQGPCLDAIETRAEVHVRSVDGEDRWPAFLPEAVAQGMACCLSFPLEVDDRAVGALSLYRFRPVPFTAGEEESARRFAAETTRAMVLAVRQARQSQLNEDLESAMASRRVIDQALGIIMAQNRCTADDAFVILRSASQHRNVKLRDVAAGLVQKVSGQQPSDDAQFRA